MIGRTRGLVVALVLTMGLCSAACATRGQVADLERRLDEVAATAARAEKKAEAAEARAAAAEGESNRAASMAESAASDAASAADSASAAVKKSEAIFNKTVRK